MTAVLGSPVYLTITLGLLLASAVLWGRRYRKEPELPIVFVGGIVGAFLGAKLVFLLAEGWSHLGTDDLWMRLASGKTVTGALLGGYVGIEIAKRRIGYRRATGDFFAFVVPISLIVGRLGCLHQGCCPGKACAPDSWFAMHDAAGIARWPAVPVEMGFQAVALTGLTALRTRPRMRGQLFHVYLIAYGIFRFAHEYVRDTPRLVAGISGYQVAAVALIALGALRFRQRDRERQVMRETSAPPGPAHVDQF